MKYKQGGLVYWHLGWLLKNPGLNTYFPYFWHELCAYSCPFFVGPSSIYFFQFSLSFFINIKNVFWIRVSCHLLNDISKNSNFYRVPLNVWHFIETCNQRFKVQLFLNHVVLKVKLISNQIQWRKLQGRNSYASNIIQWQFLKRLTFISKMYPMKFNDGG